MIVQPSLLKAHVQRVSSRVFVCGPGYSSTNIAIRELARKALSDVPNVKTIYGEEIEKEISYKKQGKDLQTLEAMFAHDVDFTLLVLESPGSIAELGTFSQISSIRERLVVLVSNKFFLEKSYIARGPLSLVADRNPNNVIYYDLKDNEKLFAGVRYPLTFYKYAAYTRGSDYYRNTMISHSKDVSKYVSYMEPIRRDYNAAVALMSIIVGDGSSYSDLLLYSGLAPKQLNSSLHSLFSQKKIEKIGSGRYRAIAGYSDEILQPFSSTSLSRLRAETLAKA